MAEHQTTRNRQWRALQVLTWVGAALSLSFMGGQPAVAQYADPAFSGGLSGNARSALEQHNRTRVLDFYNKVYGEGRTDLIDRYVAGNLIQHDPGIAAGRAGLTQWVQQQLALSPRPVVTVKRTIADGAYVLVHAQVSATPLNEFSGTAQVELFRLSGGQIVEQWAVRQPVSPTSANGHSMFSDVYVYSGSAEPVSQAREEKNKALTAKLLTILFAGQDISVIDRYWGGNAFVQHNPQAPDGTEPLKGIAFVPKPTPFAGWNTRIAAAEGDLVFVLSQSMPVANNLASDFNGLAAADLFRIVGGVIVEHWDVLAPVPPSSLNGNSPFTELFLSPF